MTGTHPVGKKLLESKQCREALECDRVECSGECLEQCPLSSQTLVKEPTPMTELRSLFFSADICGQKHSHLHLLASDHLQSQDEGAKKQFSLLGYHLVLDIL